MGQRYYHTLTIYFYKGNNNTFINEFPIDVPYIGSKPGYMDTFIFFKNKVEIHYNRSSKHNPNTFENEVLKKSQGSIYEQIIRALSYYYATNDKLSTIEKITLSNDAKDKNKIKRGKEFEIKDIINPIESSLTKKYSFNKTNLAFIFNNSPRDKSLLVAFSYYLNALSIKNIDNRFEQLWRCYDRLCFCNNNNSDKEAPSMMEMFQLLKNNPSLYKTYNNQINNLWNWIERDKNANNFKCLKKTFFTEGKKLKIGDTNKFVFYQFTDDILLCKIQEFISNYIRRAIQDKTKHNKANYKNQFNYLCDIKSNYSTVNFTFEKYINERIRTEQNQATKNDGDLFKKISQRELSAYILDVNRKKENIVDRLGYLLNKYIYFIRNQRFHGQIVNQKFKLHLTEQDDEMILINKLLEEVLLSLFKNNTLIHQWTNQTNP